MSSNNAPQPDSNDGQQADKNTEARTPGTPLTLDAALLRIAELEQNAADAAKARKDREFSARIRHEAERLAEQVADVIRDDIANRLAEDWEQAAQGLPDDTEREKLIGALEQHTDADAFACMLTGELLPDYVIEFAEEELESAIAAAVRTKEEEERPRTERDALAGWHRCGLADEAASLGLRILDAKEKGREIGGDTPEAAEIATGKLRLAETLHGLGNAVDNARPEELPALLAGSMFARKEAA